MKSVTQQLLLCIFLVAQCDAVFAADQPGQHRTAMSVSVTVVDRCMSISQSAALADKASDGAVMPASLTV